MQLFFTPSYRSRDLAHAHFRVAFNTGQDTLLEDNSFYVDRIEPSKLQSERQVGIKEILGLTPYT